MMMLYEIEDDNLWVGSPYEVTALSDHTECPAEGIYAYYRRGRIIGFEVEKKVFDK